MTLALSHHCLKEVRIPEKTQMPLVIIKSGLLAVAHVLQCVKLTSKTQQLWISTEHVCFAFRQPWLFHWTTSCTTVIRYLIHTCNFISNHIPLWINLHVGIRLLTHPHISEFVQTYVYETASFCLYLSDGARQTEPQLKFDEKKQEHKG